MHGILRDRSRDEGLTTESSFITRSDREENELQV